MIDGLCWGIETGQQLRVCRALLFGRGGGLCGDQFRSLLLEVGGFGGGVAKVRLAKVGGKGGWGGVDLGNPAGTADRFGFDRSVGVELELNDRVLSDACGLAVIEAVDLPGTLVKGVESRLFFPDRTVGVFTPFGSVAVVFPEGGILRDSFKVKIPAEGTAGGGGAWIVLEEELPGWK